MARLRTMPSIGPVTALAFVAALDDVTRFHSAHQVQAYLGLVPSEYSSGDHRLRGRITKRGDARMRWLLVEAAWRILRSPNPELATLKAWAQQIAQQKSVHVGECQSDFGHTDGPSRTSPSCVRQVSGQGGRGGRPGYPDGVVSCARSSRRATRDQRTTRCATCVSRFQ